MEKRGGREGGCETVVGRYAYPHCSLVETIRTRGGAGRRAELPCVMKPIIILSVNFGIRQQQRFKTRIQHLCQNVRVKTSVQPLHGRRASGVTTAARRRRPAYAATLRRQVYNSSFWTSTEVYETSRDRGRREEAVGGKVTRLAGSRVRDAPAATPRHVTDSIIPQFISRLLLQRSSLASYILAPRYDF